MPVEFHNFVAIKGDPDTVDALLAELHSQFDLRNVPEFWMIASQAADAERDHLPVRLVEDGMEFLFTTKHRHVGSLCCKFVGRHPESTIELWLGRTHQLTFNKQGWACFRYPGMHRVAEGTCADYHDRRLEPDIVCDLQACGLWTGGPLDAERLMDN